MSMVWPMLSLLLISFLLPSMTLQYFFSFLFSDYSISFWWSSLLLSWVINCFPSGFPLDNFVSWNSLQKTEFSLVSISRKKFTTGHSIIYRIIVKVWETDSWLGFQKHQGQKETLLYNQDAICRIVKVSLLHLPTSEPSPATIERELKYTRHMIRNLPQCEIPLPDASYNRNSIRSSRIAITLLWLSKSDKRTSLVELKYYPEF